MSEQVRYWLFIIYSGWKEVDRQKYLMWQKSDRFGCHWEEPRDFGSEGVVGKITQGEVTAEKYPSDRTLVEFASRAPALTTVCEKHNVTYPSGDRCYHCHVDSGAM